MRSFPTHINLTLFAERTVAERDAGALQLRVKCGRVLARVDLADRLFRRCSWLQLYAEVDIAAVERCAVHERAAQLYARDSGAVTLQRRDERPRESDAASVPRSRSHVEEQILGELGALLDS